MIEQIPDGAGYWAVTILIALVAIWRIQADDRWFAPDARFWFVLRRAALPTLDRALDSVPFLYAKTRVRENEHVETLDITLEQLYADLGNEGYEIQPLASIARDWEDRYERSSWARYYDEKFAKGYLPDSLVEALPEWTRRRQVHIRPFADDDGGPVTITAHAEYNPWRPFLAFAHLFAIGFDAEEGVRMARADLGLEADQDELTHA